MNHRDCSHVLIAEFKAPNDQRVRLYRVLDDSANAWWGYLDTAAHGFGKSTIEILKNLIRNTIRDGHSSVSSFVIALHQEGGWAPVTAFAFLDDTRGKADNEIDHIIDFSHKYVYREFIDSIILWVLCDLLGLDLHQDVFPGALFRLHVPAPVGDADLQTWTHSSSYIKLGELLQKWTSEPSSHQDDSLDPRVDEIAEEAEVVIGEFPSVFLTYDDWVGSPFEEDATNLDAIEFAVSHSSRWQYIAALLLFDPKVTEASVIEPRWQFMQEGRPPRRYEGSGSDLLTALVASDLIIPESAYEAWLDAHIAVPTEVFLDLDLEPYFLLETRVPWLWTAEEAKVFFGDLEKERQGGRP